MRISDMIVRKRVWTPEMVDRKTIREAFLHYTGYVVENVIEGEIPEAESIKTRISTYYGNKLYKKNLTLSPTGYSKLMGLIVGAYQPATEVFFRSTRDWRAYAKGVYEGGSTCQNKNKFRDWFASQPFFRFVTLRINKGENKARCIAYVDPEDRYIYLFNLYNKKNKLLTIGWFIKVIELALGMEMNYDGLINSEDYLPIPTYHNSASYVVYPKTKKIDWNTVLKDGTTIRCNRCGKMYQIKERSNCIVCEACTGGNSYL